jgi:G3E family GTPase
MTGIQPNRTPLKVITGFHGVGKTTAILHLLENRPQGEKWVVLLNEFGHIGIDQKAFQLKGGILVKELASGCISCTLASRFTPTLLRLENKRELRLTLLSWLVGF